MNLRNTKITIVVDTPSSWMIRYAKEYVANQSAKGLDIKFTHDYSDISEGCEITVFLSCQKIVGNEILKKSKHNLVVHESDLPLGKGWSPLTWQILEGKNEIPITLFEAASQVDSGNIYLKDSIKLDGTELIDEMREKQAKKTFELIDRFLQEYPKIEGKKQEGKSTFYNKRGPKDSELDIDKTIREQINLLRTVDNERYPAYFVIKGKKYVLKIFKETI
ncbi:methionyl-tRNA formyltransferase [Candidatus Micrarchaeota archaeon]|nr:methionyl-tRNA formyltransferase [Candidatus Micrarchaeota archaeon]